MSRRRQPAPPPSARTPAPSPTPHDTFATLAALVLGATLVGATLLVDTLAESAFDAPKRLASLLGAGIASAILLMAPTTALRRWRTWPRLQRLVAGLALLALLGTLLSALASPRPALALESLRGLALYALLLPLGASRAVTGARGRALLAVFLAASAFNTLLSLCQIAGIVSLFDVVVQGGRRDAGALLGNDGYVSLACAMALVATLALLPQAGRTRLRMLLWLAVGLGVAGLVFNQSLTAMLALLSGSSVLLVLGLRPRGLTLLPGAAVILGSLLLTAPASQRLPLATTSLAGASTSALARSQRIERLDVLLSYRLGPWAAAAEMVAERPLVGFGPGSFGAEYVPHRLAAEVRWRARLTNPFLAGAYGEAHNEYLQAAAELGLPAAGAAVAAGGLLLLGLLRVARAGHQEAVVVLALLLMAAVAASAWFVFQRPTLLVPLLLCAGRAWRLLEESPA